MGDRGRARCAPRRRPARAGDRVSRLARVAEDTRRDGGGARGAGRARACPCAVESARGGKEKMTRIATGAVFLAGVLLAAAAAAQSWPQKPVRFIVPFPPGGATDISARLLGERLGQMWGQTVIIENRAGAGGSLGASEAARSEERRVGKEWRSGGAAEH